MQIEKALQNLGLSEKEARVYIALVKLDKSTATKIAKKSDLKRPTVYLVLDELRKKGLVLKIPNPKKQIFIAKDPRELVGEAENKIDSAKKVLPELLALSGEEKKPRILYFEGIKEIENLLWHKLDEMNNKTLFGFYGHGENCPKKLLDLFTRKYQKELDKRNIKIKGIAPTHASLKKIRKQDEEHGRTIKKVPFSEYSSGMQIDIGESFVRILSFQDLQGVVIENKHIAKTMKQIFDMTWKKN